MKYIAQIPVRLGSKRVPKKNLRLLNGKPMVLYSLEAAMKSKKIDKVYINGEGEIMRKLSLEYGANFYDRPKSLLKDTVVQDQFNYDFLLNHECENLVLVNPVSPLVLTKDIDDAIYSFESNNYDSLISVTSHKYQSFFNGQALNFNTNALLPMTQSLEPVKTCSWTVCIWNREKFIAHYEKHGFAVFVGNYGLFEFDPVRSLKVSEEHEFQLAESMLFNREKNNLPLIEYYEG